jgi:hypothetical protein
MDPAHRHYTSGPRQAWAAALLEVMRVDLLAALGALPAMPPAITRDDIAKQFVTDLLGAALDGPTTPARWTRHRLITRATTSAQRVLVDELRSATDESELPPQPDGSSQVSMQLRELMVDIEAGRMPRKAVAILSTRRCSANRWPLGTPPPKRASAPTQCGCSETAR